MPHENPSDDALRALLTRSHTVAVVGASSKPDRPSFEIMNILIHAGFHVIPVTPRESTVLGRPAYATLADIPEPVDIVDVFRRAEDTPAVAEEAVKIGAKALWLQLGISNDDAARIATDGGLTVVMDRCIGQTVKRLGVRSSRAERDVTAPADVNGAVAEASQESFPASDAPAWGPLHAGAPDRHT